MGEAPVGAPALEAKELASLTLHRKRVDGLRLDYGPFVAGYTLAGMQYVYNNFKERNEQNDRLKIMLGIVLAVHILLMLFTHWSVRIKALCHFVSARNIDEAEWVMVTKSGHQSKTELVQLWSRTYEDADGKETSELTFEFLKIVFVYVAERHAFVRLPFPDRELLGHYRKSGGYGKETEIMRALQRWGPNKFEVPIPTFVSLLKEQMLAPFFCFQVFCVGLWFMDEYWMYSLFTLGMLVVFECTVVMQRIRNLKDLHSLQTPKQALQVYRHGSWAKVSGDALLPGDVVSVGRASGHQDEDQIIPADCLLLAGTVIVDEAVLTGESTPQWKSAIGQRGDLDPAIGDGVRLQEKVHKGYMLFGGTKILQNTPNDEAAKIKTPDNGCLAVVLRTGFETAQGSLMRTISHSQDRITANTWETGAFIGFLLIFAVAAAYHVVSEGLRVGRDKFKLYLNATMIVTSVIPPELPMELTMAVNTALLALVRKRVFCTEPFRIPFAGKVEVCCFDKTGTLTSDNLILKGLSYVEGKGRGDAPLAEVKDVPRNVSRVLGACHSLMKLEGEIIGDPLEKAGFMAAGWGLAGDCMSAPGKREQAHVVTRFAFSSALKRMSVIVRIVDGDGDRYAVVSKGAPEVLEGLLADVPPEYEATYKRHASEGSRIISLGWKALPAGLTRSQVAAMRREEVECGLSFAGFAVFATTLKPESEPALKMLRDSSHQLVMITGDAPLTACHAAAQVHIVDRTHLILTHTGRTGFIPGTEDDGEGAAVEPDDCFHWISPDETIEIPFSRERGDILLIAEQYDLCVAGDALHHVHQIALDRLVIPLAQVFARVSPDQKELIINTLRAEGLTTLMCGDGTNDVGGLKAAHVGVALLAPSEIAAKIKAAREARMKAKKDGTALAAKHEAVLAKLEADKKKAREGKVPQGKKLLDEIRARGQEPSQRMLDMAEWMDKMEAEQDAGPPMVKPGDASMAASFTAKADSVMPCCDIIRQGRCSLVTTVQMFKILGLMCLSTAFSLSVMYLNGVKLGDYQATLGGLLSAGLFFFISQSKPLPVLSKTRPHPDIFSLYVFGSTLLQFAVHLGFLVYMYTNALKVMPETERQDPWDESTEFKPNLVNTVSYLCNQYIQLTTFAVNYVGEPFNTGITANKPLYNGCKYGFLFLLVVSVNVVPDLTRGFELVVMPDDMKTKMVVLAVLDFVITAAIEHTLRRMLPARLPAPKGYMAHAKEIAAIKGSRTYAKKRE